MILIIFGDLMTKDRFKFERDGFDFPFYDDIKSLSKVKWIVLSLSYIITFCFLLFPVPLSSFFGTNIITENITLIFCLIPVIGFGFASDFNFGTVFKKIKSNDILLIIVTLILVFVYSMGMVYILSFLGVHVVPDSVMAHNPLNNIFSTVAIFLQLLGEEFIKLVPFLLILTLLYYYSSNRKLSIVIAALLAMLLFGIAHWHAYDGNIIQILLIQGLGSLIPFFTYIKTKNLLISYIVHVAEDISIFALVMLATYLSHCFL